jgi:HEAT repeats
MHSWEGDPNQQAIREYGRVGPGSDLTPDRSIDPQAASWRILFAVIAGIVLAGLVAAASARGTLPALAQFLGLRGNTKAPSPPSLALSGRDLEQLDRESPQNQAQLLLDRAVNHHQGATEQIQSRMPGWQGKLRLTPKLNSLITSAFDSNDLQVRAAAIDIDLAALNVARTSESVERLSREAESGPQSQRVWALWELGLLGNRGVERARVLNTLVGHLRDPNEEVRHWAVEGLAYVGTDDTIVPLLHVFHDDPSPAVRERAASSLAHSGMLTPEQRRTAIPKLLDYAEDASLDAQSHVWIYQALHDITGQSLPNESKEWRKWYYSTI